VQFPVGQLKAGEMLLLLGNIRPPITAPLKDSDATSGSFVSVIGVERNCARAIEAWNMEVFVDRWQY